MVAVISQSYIAIAVGLTLGISVSYIVGKVRGNKLDQGQDKYVEMTIDEVYSNLTDSENPEPADNPNSNRSDQNANDEANNEGLLSKILSIDELTENDDPTNNGSSDTDQTLQDKAEYIYKEIESEKNTMSNNGDNDQVIVEAINEIADKKPEIPDDKVGKLRNTLSQDDVNSDTVKEHLEDVLTYARIAETYADTSNIKGLTAGAIDPSIDQNHELIKSFNHKLERIHELQKEVKNKKVKMKTKKDKIRDKEQKIDDLNNDLEYYEDLESNVEDSLEALENTLPLGIKYKNANLKGKLDIIVEKIKDGKIKNTPLHQNIQTIENKSDIGTSNLSTRLLNHLRKVSKGENKNSQEEAEDLQEIIATIDTNDTKIRRISSVDRNEIHQKALSIKEKAATQSGVASAAIESEIQSKILQLLSDPPNDEMVYATKITLLHLDSILDDISGKIDVNESVSDMRSEIDSKQKEVEWYMENRPEYNHDIPKLFKERIDTVTEEAVEIASSGESDIAIGRLYVADVVYDLLETLYTRQQYNSVLETR